MFEAVIESWQHKFDIPRRLAVALCGIICLGIGVFLEPEAYVGSWMDFITIIVTPLGAVLGAVSVYYVFGYRKSGKSWKPAERHLFPAGLEEWPDICMYR